RRHHDPPGGRDPAHEPGGPADVRPRRAGAGGGTAPPRLHRPEHRDIVAARVASRLAQRDSTTQVIEVETLRTDGTRFWIGAVATVIDWEGSPASLVSFVDISERRRREG